MSQNQFEQLANSQKAQTEIMLKLVRTAFHGMEQLATINLSTSRELFNSNVAHTQKLLNTQDPKALLQLNSAMVQPNLDKLLAYSRSLYELSATLQTEVSTLLGTQYKTLSEKAKSTPPIGSEFFSNAVKQVVEASNQVYDNVRLMNQQVTEMATNHIQSNASATAQAAAATKRK
ncbi:MAG: phasin family protein [Pseudomonadota bacterium]